MNTAIYPTVNPAGASPRFSLHRFGALMSRYLQSEGRTLLLTLLVVLGVLVVIFLLNIMDGSYSYPNPDAKDPAWSGECLAMEILFTVFAACCGGMMFSGMATREQRLALLTLPGSMTEKFLVRFVIYVPLAIVAFPVCAWIADAVRYLAVLTCIDGRVVEPRLMPLDYMLTFGNVVLPGTESAPWTQNVNPAIHRLNLAWYALSGWGVVLTTGAIFSMGSLIFPRKSIIKTAVACYVVSMALGLLWWASAAIFGLTDGVPDSGDPTMGRLIVRGAVMAAVVILLYWWCYARFCEDEVVERW